MKPLRLIMNAFGSYAGEELLDFTALGEGGLYLITGETGAGKTTIFDAVSYALFGRASGSARSSYKMLRSDYAQGRTKTYAELEFLSAGQVYRIRREIIPHFARGTGEVSYTDSVALTLPDGTVLDRARDVDGKILEIVGLDRDQFAQIVMIAQNDFLRFLQSGTDDRVKILRRIFGTGALKAFQEQLKLRAREKDEERKSVLRDFEKHGVDPYRSRERLEEWERELREDEAAIRRADEALEGMDRAAKELAAEIAVAQGVGKAFADLASQREALARHREKREEMEAAARRARLGETALRRVKPLADKAAQALDASRAADAERDSAKAALAGAGLALEQAEEALAALPPPDAAQAELEAVRREWEKAQQERRTLAAIREDYAAIVQKRAGWEALNGELEEISKKIAALPPPEEAQAALEELQARLAELSRRREAYAGLKAGLDDIAAREALLAAEQQEFQELTARYGVAKQRYDEAYELFLRGQAGVLARTLEEGMPCPVCGSTAHPAPAPLPHGDISEAGLKALGSEAEGAKALLDKKAAHCAALRAELKTVAGRLAPEQEAWFPGMSALRVGEALHSAMLRAEADFADGTAREAADRQALADLTAAAEEAAGSRDRLTPQCAAARAELEALAQRFFKDFAPFSPCTDMEAAGGELAALLEAAGDRADRLTRRKEAGEAEAVQLKKKWEQAQKARSDGQLALSSATALTGEREARARELTGLRDLADIQFRQALAANGFAGEEAYHAALITEEQLAALAVTLAEDEERGKALNRDIARLEAETAGKKPPELDRLNAAADEIKGDTEALRARRDEARLRHAHTSRALKELTQSAAQLTRLEKDYAALKGLSDTANGKLDFETYAQLAYFERVLRAANQRLRVMSQGRYVLQRMADSADGRRRTGLELQVADSYTGKSRSANSLSGGESFMASLSLALGLSDVVQQNAGGIHLDAMFIDEGFGSLDAEVLELAVRTLSDMAGGSRSIGIISHVAELRERIDRQIFVEKTTSGSKIRLVT